MMKSAILGQCLIVMIALASSAHATDAVGPWAPKTIPNYLPGTCIVDVNDPYEPHVRMGKDAGPVSGLCINSLQRRSAQVLDSQSDVWTVANFSYGDKFWLARIPLHKIKRVLLLVEHFPIPNTLNLVNIAHTQLRYEFEDGALVDLTEQSHAPGVTPKTASLNQMIFSIENIGPYGEAFDAFEGMKGHYHIAYRAISVQDKYQWMVVQQGHKVSQYELKLTPDQAARILQASLLTATKWSTNHAYDTFKPNCVTEIFAILDPVLGIRHQIVPWLPNVAPAAFRDRGLLQPWTSPTLNEEYAKKN